MRDSGCRYVTVYRVPLGRETRVAIEQTRLSDSQSLLDRYVSRVSKKARRKDGLSA